MKIYGIKNCDKIRKTIKWCKDNDIDYQLHDYRSDGIDADLLALFLGTFSLEELINKRSTTWRNLSEADKSSLTNECIINNPTLIKRPIVETKDAFFVGYFPEKWRNHVK
jgi:Spx/MgsR family transcriptional regulator